MPKVLLCPPDYYGIEYEINPWMSRSRGSDPELAGVQWQALHDTLRSLGCEIELIAPQRHLPDMVFTANAGLLVGSRFIRSNFRHKERRGEEAHFEQWFREREYEIVALPPELLFEGEGDALFCNDILFCGYRHRSDINSHRHIGGLLNCLVISVDLITESFYHLDTCFCPLPMGGAVWFPGAFDEYAQHTIRDHVPDLVEVTAGEAAGFACNAVAFDRHIVLPAGAPDLAGKLAARGYECHPLPMSEFLKAGGACKCLTLLLPQRS